MVCVEIFPVTLYQRIVATFKQHINNQNDYNKSLAHENGLN